MTWGSIVKRNVCVYILLHMSRVLPTFHSKVPHIGGLIAERWPCIQEVVGSIPGQGMPETWYLVLPCLVVSIKRLEQGYTVKLHIVDCKM